MNRIHCKLGYPRGQKEQKWSTYSFLDSNKLPVRYQLKKTRLSRSGKLLQITPCRRIITVTEDSLIIRKLEGY